MALDPLINVPNWVLQLNEQHFCRGPASFVTTTGPDRLYRIRLMVSVSRRYNPYRQGQELDWFSRRHTVGGCAVAVSLIAVLLGLRTPNRL